MLGLGGMREMQLAGIFYPAEKLTCGLQIEAALSAVPRLKTNRPKLIIVPHAGWSFCLDVMASAFIPLKPIAEQIRRVVLIGPAHKVAFNGLATPNASSWRTPFGEIATSDPTLSLLAIGQKVQVRDDVFEKEHALEVIAPLVHLTFRQAKLVPLLVGEASDDQVVDVLRGLWGGPETLIIVSSDLTHFLDKSEAKAIDTATCQAIESLKPQAITAREACGHRPMRAALNLARLHDLRMTALDLRNSADAAGNPEQVVGYGAFLGEYAQNAEISQDNRAILLNVARDVLKFAVRNSGKMPSLTLEGILPPELSAIRSTFVTLKLNGQLRGCIGSLQPQRSLLDDVAQNAVKAAFADPRFSPLSEKELEGLEVEVSILSHPRPLYYTSEADLVRQIRADVDGLILADEGKSGLFLPSVWESLPMATDFWRGLKRKAGLPDDYFTDTMTVRRFSVEKFALSLTKPEQQELAVAEAA